MLTMGNSTHATMATSSVQSWTASPRYVVVQTAICHRCTRAWTASWCIRHPATQPHLHQQPRSLRLPAREQRHRPLRLRDHHAMKHLQDSTSAPHPTKTTSTPTATPRARLSSPVRWKTATWKSSAPDCSSRGRLETQALWRSSVRRIGSMGRLPFVLSIILAVRRRWGCMRKLGRIF